MALCQGRKTQLKSLNGFATKGWSNRNSPSAWGDGGMQGALLRVSRLRNMWAWAMPHWTAATWDLGSLVFGLYLHTAFIGAKQVFQLAAGRMRLIPGKRWAKCPQSRRLELFRGNVTATTRNWEGRLWDCKDPPPTLSMYSLGWNSNMTSELIVGRDSCSCPDRSSGAVHASFS